MEVCGGGGLTQEQQFDLLGRFLSILAQGPVDVPGVLSRRLILLTHRAAHRGGSPTLYTSALTQHTTLTTATATATAGLFWSQEVSLQLANQ